MIKAVRKMSEKFEKEVTNNNTLNVLGEVDGNAIGQENIYINYIVNKSQNYSASNLEDQTHIPMHFNLMSSEKKISDVFVDGCYQILYIIDFEEKVKDNSPLLNDCIEVINNQRVILIEGDYGTGKTVLTKMIQNQICAKGLNTLFFNSSTLTQKECFALIQQEISSTQDNFYVFIDSIDDLTYAEIENDNAVMYVLKEIIKLAYKYKNAFFVINSRPNLKINTKNELIAQEFFFVYSQYKNTRNCIFIRTRDFDNRETNEFLKRLNSSDRPSLDTTQLKKWHKKSHSSYKNPLFAYVVGTFYYENNFKLPTDILTIYSYFVNKTIKGKFQDESPKGSQFVEKMQESYRKLLQIIAKEMISYRSSSIDYKFDNEENTVFSLKPKEPFFIKLSCLKESTIDLYEKYCKENGTLKKSVYDAAVLNCYFFKVVSIRSNETLVKFSDENIMCFLAAESAYNKFCDLIDESFGEIQAREALKNELTDFELHPMTMDFLIFLLKQLMNDEKDKLLFHLKQMIDDFNSCKNISDKEVKSQLIIHIIFIKLYNKSYKAINSQHFFKTFDKLCKTAKTFEINGCHIDGKHRYLAERYFTCCTFIECCFRRLNLKYYNYKYSKIIQTTFEQCKLDRNIFEENVFEDNRFLLCILSNIIFDFRISQGCYADNCKIINCKLQNIAVLETSENEVNICFKECSIEDLRIIKLQSGKITISFERCFIKKIFFDSCSHNNCILIENCVVENSINIKNSKLQIKNQRNLMPIFQPFITDNRSEISFI